MLEEIKKRLEENLSKYSNLHYSYEMFIEGNKLIILLSSVARLELSEYDKDVLVFLEKYLIDRVASENRLFKLYGYVNDIEYVLEDADEINDQIDMIRFDIEEEQEEE